VVDRTVSDAPARRTPAPVRGQRIALVDLLDRLLTGGVVIAGDVTISIADVDLVRISLRALVASIRPEMEEALEPSVTRVTRVTDVSEDADRPVESVVTWEDPRP
jgi:gas vesicle protein GvpA/GvpJ/GvpM family